MLIGVNRLGERHSTVLFQSRGARLFFIGTENKNFRPPIAIPIRHRDLRDAAEAGEPARTGKCAALGLRLQHELAALRIGINQIRAAIAIHIRPRAAALALGGFGQGEQFELAALEFARECFGRVRSEMMHRHAAGLLGNGNQLRAAIGVQIFRVEAAQLGYPKLQLRPELPVFALQPKPKRRGALPIHQRQITAPVAIEIHHLKRLHAARQREGNRFAQHALGVLIQHV